MNRSIIYFFGIDGSGKTTLSKKLFFALKQMNCNVSWYWWLNGEDLIIRRVIRKNFNMFSTKNKQQSSIWHFLSYVYPFIILTNYFIFYLDVIFRSQITKKQFIIFDRYIYDIVLALSNEFPFISKMHVINLYLNLFQKPDLIFYITVNPKIAYLRKKEEMSDLQEAFEKNLEYEQLAFTFQKKHYYIIKISNDDLIENSHEKIFKTFQRWLGNK